MVVVVVVVVLLLLFLLLGCMLHDDGVWWQRFEKGQGHRVTYQIAKMARRSKAINTKMTVIEI